MPGPLKSSGRSWPQAPALVERLHQATMKTSNETFRQAYAKIEAQRQALTCHQNTIDSLVKQLEKEKQLCLLSSKHLATCEAELVVIQPRLSFAPKLPAAVLSSIVSKLRRRVAGRAACVRREWQSAVETASALGMFTKVRAGAVGGRIQPATWFGSEESGFTVLATTGGVFSCGGSDQGVTVPALGHGGASGNIFVPRLIEALADKTVVGVSAGERHTVAWTDAGELFTFGAGDSGQLGHGGHQLEAVPRLVEALAGKNVSGASAGGDYTAVWTDEGELYTFGSGNDGQLGHGGHDGEENERVPRLVDALVGNKVAGASAGQLHTVMWTEAGELFTFGDGSYGQLGHGGQHWLAVRIPRLVEGMAGKKVVGASAGEDYTVVWTDAGELFTFGSGDSDSADERGKLGHGGSGWKLVPTLVELLAGEQMVDGKWESDAGIIYDALGVKRVIGASAGKHHTAVWTDAGELFTFGNANNGKLGHGETWRNDLDLVPRLVEALAGQEVIGAAAGDRHTVAWTAFGEIFTFGSGLHGRLGHGVYGEEESWSYGEDAPAPAECRPRLIEAEALM